MNICVIPARSGSKRIKDKNIEPFLGRPIISYSIETAKATEMFTRIIVSTDSERYGEIAENYGAEWLPRTEYTSGDMARDENVMREVLGQIPCHYMCYLYPCAPLVRPGRLMEGFQRMQLDRTIGSVSVIQAPQATRYTVVDGMGQRREKEERFVDAGQFYWIDVSWFLNVDNDEYLKLPKTMIVLRGNETQDINLDEDWSMAEFKYFMMHRRGV